jgi:hypothetical protein
MNSISYLCRKEIDDDKWNSCIKGADNGLIYARTFFLDNMAGDWDALIQDDYESVMPLVWRKKFGIWYLYQPYFIAQLGIFGQNLSPESVGLFLKHIPVKFRYIDIDFNERNYLTSQQAGEFAYKMKISTRVNFFLNPALPDSAMKGYHRLARRMLQKAFDESVKINREPDPHKIIEFYRQQYSKPKISEDVYERLLLTARVAIDTGHCNLYMATINHSTVAVYLVMHDEVYFYSVLGGSSDQGKNAGAFYALTDAAIRDAGESGKIFRFEGSDIPGIASFNAQFGGIQQSYQHLKYNNLPLIIRWMK